MTRTTRDEVDRLLGRARRCLSFWRRALLVFVLTALVAGPFAVTLPRSYKSETVILYQERIRSTDLTGGSDESHFESTRRLWARLREALLSRSSLEPIIVDLHLYPREVEQRGLVDAVEEMRKHISFRTREGDTFEIGFEGLSPDEVKEVTERLADCIVKEAATRRAEHAKTLKEFVDAESKRNQVELKSGEAALASFLALHPELRRLAANDDHALTAGAEGAAVGATAPRDLPLAVLEQRAARVEAQLNSRPRAPTAAVAPPPPPKPPEPPVPEPPELVAARRDLADKLGKFMDKHPDVQASRNHLHAVEAAHAAHVAALARNRVTTDADQPAGDAPAGGATTDDRATLREQLASLRAQIAVRRASGAARGASSEKTSVTLEVELRRLQREVSDARERQRQLDEKQFKAGITASSVMDDRNVQVLVLDPAFRPSHASSRPRSTLLGAALLVCLFFAVFTACASAWLDDRIHDRLDLEQLQMIPVFAVIPPGTTRAWQRSNGDG